MKCICVFAGILAALAVGACTAPQASSTHWKIENALAEGYQYDGDNFYLKREGDRIWYRTISASGEEGPSMFSEVNCTRRIHTSTIVNPRSVETRPESDFPLGSRGRRDFEVLCQ